MKTKFILISILSLFMLNCELVDRVTEKGEGEVLDSTVVEETTLDNNEVVEPVNFKRPEIRQTPSTLETKTPKVKSDVVTSNDVDEVLEDSDLDELPYLVICADLSKDRKRVNCTVDTLLEIVVNEFVLDESLVDEVKRGKVVVQFVVGTNGKISDAEILSDFGYNSGDQVLKIINRLNRKGLIWTPGIVEDEPVSSYFELPISFRF